MIRIFQMTGLLACLGLQLATAAEYRWIGASGNWNDPSRWDIGSGFPNAPGDTAIVTGLTSRTIALNQGEITVGTIVSAPNDWQTTTIITNATNQVLILDNGSEPAWLLQPRGLAFASTVLQAPICIVNGLVVSNAHRADYPVTLAGAISGPNADITVVRGRLQLAPPQDLIYSNRLTTPVDGPFTGAIQKAGTANLILTGTNVCTLAGDWTSGGRAIVGGTLTIAGGLVSNLVKSTLMPFFGSENSALVVTNGGRLIHVYAGNPVRFSRPTNVIEITGHGSLWALGGNSVSLDTTNNTLRVLNGARMENVATLSLLTSNNTVIVSGTSPVDGSPALVLMPGASPYLTIGNATSHVYNTVIVGPNGILSNAVVEVGGSDGASVGGGSFNRFTLREGGAVYSTSDGYNRGSCIGISTLGASRHNTATVTGSGALWDLKGYTLRVGYAAGAGAITESNSLEVSGGGILTNVGLLQIGVATANATSQWNRLIVHTGGVLHAAQATVGSGVTQGNVLHLEGGLFRAGILTVNTNNVFAPVLREGGIPAATVTGTVVFSAGSYLWPTNRPGTPSGTYTVLTAGTIINQGLTLHPSVDPSSWSFAVVDGNRSLRVTYWAPKSRGTLFLIR